MGSCHWPREVLKLITISPYNKGHFFIDTTASRMRKHLGAFWPVRHPVRNLVKELLVEQMSLFRSLNLRTHFDMFALQWKKRNVVADESPENEVAVL